jgi:uncharacterized membrane protein
MRLLGHPIHPMLVHFPIVFWTVAAVAYVADAADIGEGAATVAKYSNGAGLIMAALAMIAGLLELRSIEGRSKTMQVAISHMMVMATAWLCFLLALVLPISSGPRVDHSTAQLASVVSAVVGFLAMGAGGWLGGRLVYEFGTGVRSPPEPQTRPGPQDLSG